jgi:ribonuclease VapC
MIVDTSALVAVLKSEAGSDKLLLALVDQAGWIPSPVLVELRRVTKLAQNRPDPDVDAMLAVLNDAAIGILAFDVSAAEAAAMGNAAYGTGNGRGGKLNMLDLMVYGVAKATGLPILCTGKDFIRTDALIHPASRRDV